MSTLTVKKLEAYDAKLQQIADVAAECAGRAYDALRAQNLNASIAEIREGAIELVLASVDTYGDMACEAAADFYDSLVVMTHEKSKPAELPPVDKKVHNVVERMIRNEVGVLIADEQRDDI